MTQSSAIGTSMHTLFVSYDPKSQKAAKLIDALRCLDFLTIEESPYDPHYVEQVKAMDKSTFRTVKRENIWD